MDRFGSGVCLSYQNLCRNLKLGDGVTIGDDVVFRGGLIELGDHCTVEDGVLVDVVDRLCVGSRGFIGRGSKIMGRNVELGPDFWGTGFTIGGGSCFETRAIFSCGRFCHLGEQSFINIAREVRLGHEVGLGMETKIFTHGAYLSAFDGFPVSFAPVTVGDRVWIPNATVLPGVRIGSDVVVAAGSLVNSSLPDGVLAGGVPARVIQVHAYPRVLTLPEQKLWLDFFVDDLLVNTGFGSKLSIRNRSDNRVVFSADGRELVVDCASSNHEVRPGQTVFSISDRAIFGLCDGSSESLRNILRRMGVRFWSTGVNGSYVSDL